MTNEPVNWDEAFQAADNSPRSIIAEVLGRVDEWESVVIVTRGKDEKLHRWLCGTDQEIMSLLAMAQYYQAKQIAGDD